MLVADHHSQGTDALGREEHASVPPGHRHGGQESRGRALEPEIETELVKHLVGQAPTGFVTGTLTVAAVLLVLWNAAPRDLLLVWLISLGLLSLPAFVVVWRFPRTPLVPGKIASWRRALAVRRRNAAVVCQDGT